MKTEQIPTRLMESLTVEYEGAISETKVSFDLQELMITQSVQVLHNIGKTHMISHIGTNLLTSMIKFFSKVA